MLKIKLKWEEYLNFLKKKEISVIFDNFADIHFKNGLEIGAGDGFQSRLLANYCDNLTCSEYNEERLVKTKIKNIRYNICDVENLPFENKIFDFIFSSNVLEHIPNQKKALGELKRCLYDDGIMIHILPSRVWKFLDFTLYYPNLLVKLIEGNLFEKKFASNVKSQNNNVINDSLFKKILRNLWPPIHGEYISNFKEFIAFGEKNWIKLFENQGFKVIKVKRIVLCSGYGFGFNKLRNFGEKIGFYSTNAYFIVKKSNKNYSRFI